MEVKNAFGKKENYMVKIAIRDLLISILKK